MNKLLDFIIGREHNYNCQKGVTYALCTRDALSKKREHLTNAPPTNNTNRADTCHEKVPHHPDRPRSSGRYREALRRCQPGYPLRRRKPETRRQRVYRSRVKKLAQPDA